MARRKVWMALSVAAGSFAGSVVMRRRRRLARRADLYFDDGSMLSLTEGSADTDRLLPLAYEALAVAPVPAGR